MYNQRASLFSSVESAARAILDARAAEKAEADRIEAAKQAEALEVAREIAAVILDGLHLDSGSAVHAEGGLKVIDSFEGPEGLICFMGVRVSWAGPDKAWAGMITVSCEVPDVWTFEQHIILHASELPILSPSQRSGLLEKGDITRRWDDYANFQTGKTADAIRAHIEADPDAWSVLRAGIGLRMLDFKANIPGVIEHDKSENPSKYGVMPEPAPAPTPARPKPSQVLLSALTAYIDEHINGGPDFEE